MIDKIGEYHVLGSLGKGAHSTILHIRRSADSKQYALKIVPITSREDDKFLEQAEHEFRVAQKLTHANLIKIHCLEKKRALGFFGVRELRLLIDYVKGKTLDQFKIIPISKLIQIFLQVAEGLAHMHRRDIYHGDLKPNNLMLSVTGEIKIIDYGLSWIKGEPKARIQGTPEYMAPEQITQRTVTELTDLFNFGATMYRLVTFRNIPPMLSGQATLSTNAKAWQAMLKPVRDLNPQAPMLLAKTIEHCLAHHPSQRPASVLEVRDVLKHMADEVRRNEDERLENWDWSAEETSG